MTFDNFEESFTENRLRNGLAYFRKGKVTNLEEDEDGDWSATVVGTEEYEIDIITHRQKITDTSCTCPSHFEENPCKHVAAVLYAIKAEMDEEAAQAENVEIPANILQLLEEMRADELRMFLKIELKGNEKMIRSLEVCGTYFLLCRGADDLARELSDKIEKFEVEGTFEKKDVPAIVETAAAYVDAAAKHREKKEIKHALDHLLAVTDVLPFQASFMDDEHGIHRTVVLRAFQLIDEICQKEKIGESVRGLLSDYAFNGAADANVPITGYEVHWLDLIVKHGLAKERADEFIQLLDAQLENHKSNQDDATCARLLRLKLEFLRTVGQKGAAKKILENNPTVANEQEQVILSATKNNGEYKITKQKMLAELELARANGDKEQVATLQKLIIELLESKSDVLDLRKLAEQFYLETSDPVFFEAMKGTYMKAEWEKVKGRFEKGGNPLRKV